MCIIYDVLIIGVLLVSQTFLCSPHTHTHTSFYGYIHSLEHQRNEKPCAQMYFNHFIISSYPPRASYSLGRVVVLARSSRLSRCSSDSRRPLLLLLSCLSARLLSSAGSTTDCICALISTVVVLVQKISISQLSQPIPLLPSPSHSYLPFCHFQAAGVKWRTRETQWKGGKNKRID